MRSLARSMMLLLSLLPLTPLVAAKLPAPRWPDPIAWSCAKSVSIHRFNTRLYPESAELARKTFNASFTKRLAAKGITIGSPGDVVVDLDVLDFHRTVPSGVGDETVPRATATIRVKGSRINGDLVFELTVSKTTMLSSSDDPGFGAFGDVAALLADTLLKQRTPCLLGDVIPPPAPATASPAVLTPMPPAVPEAPTAPLTPIAPEPPAAPAEGRAEVTFDANVPNAEVIIDGAFVGNTPIASYKLTAGLHTIEITAPKRKSWKRELKVTAGSVTRVVGVLEVN